MKKIFHFYPQVRIAWVQSISKVLLQKQKAYCTKNQKLRDPPQATEKNTKRTRCSQSNLQNHISTIKIYSFYSFTENLNGIPSLYHMIHECVGIPHLIVVPCHYFHEITSHHACEREIGNRCIRFA